MKDTLVKTSIEKLHRAGGEKRERRLNNAYLPKTFHNDCRLTFLSSCSLYNANSSSYWLESTLTAEFPTDTEAQGAKPQEPASEGSGHGESSYQRRSQIILTWLTEMVR